MALPIMGLIGGATQIAGSLIGGRRRRRQARQAEAAFNTARQQFQDFQFENPYAGLENTFEDATINQQATQFQAQQTDAALAQALQAATMAGGAPGGAQAIAQAALRSKAGISADIAKQEQANQARALAQEAKLNQLVARGEDTMQARNYARTQQMLNLASVEKNAADQARAQATAGLVGGIGSMLGGVGTAAKSAGGFGEGFMDELFKIA